ncbi:Peptidoglycan-binding LysM [Alkaliphilus metalliredigens QYMF]|uniref:Peptidoglycan-binding LysM n=1 Tax=Alkaliphilus metalliredigens (strain QYMF) TaxID=293826 RepID=A6TUD8_ALKMQ|nr:LysM peptidoglycan-binding domain-containing protein [Alkaliphilus metalliredigens]ABR49806.1 Peptidoglycan-binding LysM [Alkaliphilus metalliredigens QYMF]
MYHNYPNPYENSYGYGMPPMASQQPTMPEPPRCPGGTIYTVRPGDSMFRIANQFGISLQALIQANPQVTNPNVIFVGQRICVPTVVVPPPPPGPFCPDGTIYVVQRGDTMFNIARRFGVTLQRLIQANPQVADPNVLDVGQQICVPVPDAPLPEGICRVALRPERTGVLGGTAFINLDDPTIWITTFGLPCYTTIDDGEYTCYYAWVVDRDAPKYYRVDLKDCNVPGIRAGYAKDTGSWRGYDEIIVTAEKSAVKAPTGPVFLRGSLAQCR